MSGQSFPTPSTGIPGSLSLQLSIKPSDTSSLAIYPVCGVLLGEICSMQMAFAIRFVCGYSGREGRGGETAGCVTAINAEGYRGSLNSGLALVRTSPYNRGLFAHLDAVLISISITFKQPFPTLTILIPSVVGCVLFHLKRADSNRQAGVYSSPPHTCASSK